MFMRSSSFVNKSIYCRCCPAMPQSVGKKHFVFSKMKSQVYVMLLVVFMHGKSCLAKQYSCSSDIPVFVWPLRHSTGLFEVMANSTDGVLNDVKFIPPTLENHSALSSSTEFTGGPESFVALNVSYNDAFLGDYTIQFYAFFNDVSAGTILHYESNEQDDITYVEMLHISVINGNIVIAVKEFGSVTYLTDNIIPGEWIHIMFERDLSKSEVKLYVNRIAQKELTVNKQFSEKLTKAPGVLYLGGKPSVTPHFSGRLACLQIIPCKSTTSLDYDNYCINASVVNIYTTGSVSSTTALTTGSTVTTTGQDPISTESTTLLATVSTTSTASPTTLSAPDTPNSPPVQPDFDRSVLNQCVRYSVVQHNAAFSDPGHIIHTVLVPDVVKCSQQCNKFQHCVAFTVKPTVSGYTCSIGLYTHSLTPLEGSVFYARVFN